MDKRHFDDELLGIPGMIPSIFKDNYKLAKLAYSRKWIFWRFARYIVDRIDDESIAKSQLLHFFEVISCPGGKPLFDNQALCLKVLTYSSTKETPSIWRVFPYSSQSYTQYADKARSNPDQNVEEASSEAYRNRLLKLVAMLISGKNTTVTARLQTEITLRSLTAFLNDNRLPLSKKSRYLHLLHVLYLDSAVIDTALKYEQSGNMSYIAFLSLI